MQLGIKQTVKKNIDYLVLYSHSKTMIQTTTKSVQ